MIEGVKKDQNQIWMGDASQQLYQDAKDDRAFETVYRPMILKWILFDINFEIQLASPNLRKHL